MGRIEWTVIKTMKFVSKLVKSWPKFNRVIPQDHIYYISISNWIHLILKKIKIVHWWTLLNNRLLLLHKFLLQQYATSILKFSPNVHISGYPNIYHFENLDSLTRWQSSDSYQIFFWSRRVISYSTSFRELYAGVWTTSPIP